MLIPGDVIKFYEGGVGFSFHHVVVSKKDGCLRMGSCCIKAIICRGEGEKNFLGWLDLIILSITFHEHTRTLSSVVTVPSFKLDRQPITGDLL